MGGNQVGREEVKDLVGHEEKASFLMIRYGPALLRYHGEDAEQPIRRRQSGSSTFSTSGEHLAFELDT